MKILVLTKRQYMAKDLLDDRFGRFREVPLELAKLGHQVVGICLSYSSREVGLTDDFAPDGHTKVTWYSFNLGRGVIPGIIKHLARTASLVKQFRPDLIWACSDSFHAIFGVWLATFCRTKCVVDLYDNFESFQATMIPGIRPLFRRAVRAADGVTCVSHRLADLVVRSYHRAGPVMILENAVRRDLFYHRERTACRDRLGLPQEVKILGTAGALYASRGIDVLFRGFERLASEENLHLAIAGPRDSNIHIPYGPRVHDLGILPLERVPILLNALDVAVVCNRNSNFGLYNFPQKAREIIACKTPLVAAAVGTMTDLLSSHPECLFDPESAESLARSIRLQLAHPTIIGVQVPAWSDAAQQLERFFLGILKAEQ